MVWAFFLVFPDIIKNVIRFPRVLSKMLTFSQGIIKNADIFQDIQNVEIFSEYFPKCRCLGQVFFNLYNIPNFGL